MKTGFKLHPYLLVGLVVLTLTNCKKEEATPAPARVAPTIEITEVSEVMYTTLSGKGRVSDRGSSAVTNYGLCWRQGEAIPTIQDSSTDGFGYQADGTFSVLCFRLLPNTTYSVRSYATNSGGTSYGPTRKITTPNLSSSPQPANGAYTSQFKFTVKGQQAVTGGVRVSIEGTGNFSFMGDGTFTDEFDYLSTGAATHKLVFTDTKGEKLYVDLNTQTGPKGITGISTFTGGTGPYAKITGTGKNVGPLVNGNGGTWEDAGTVKF